MARELEIGSDVRTFGIVERPVKKLEDELIRFEMGDMSRPEAQNFVQRFKSSGDKLASKLIVDFEEVYGAGALC